MNKIDISQMLGFDFEPELLKEMESRSEVVSYRQGETIIRYGHFIRFMPLVLEGSIKVMRQDEDGHEMLLYYLNGHEACVMTINCCMMQGKSSISAMAETDCTVLQLPTDINDEWLCRYPGWKRFMMGSMLGRLEDLMVAIDKIAFSKADERLVEYLLKLSAVKGSNILDTNHQQIATDLSLSRELVSRLLKKLELDGKLVLGRGRIELRGL